MRLPAIAHSLTQKASARCSGIRSMVRAMTFPVVRARRQLTLPRPAA
ncbi:hypothetical protein QFZ76_002001 [Streptomyces sp. V4I2]|nr:hypothetical protein [Streptomyces sp. V4I2]